MASYFTENQKLISSINGKIAVGAIILAAIAPYVILFIEFEKTSQKPAVWYIMGVMSLCMCILLFLIFKSQMSLTISKEGIVYSYAPFLRKKRNIKWSEVESYEVREYSPVKEFGGYGFRRNPRKQTLCLNVSGKHGLDVLLKDGKRIMFGSQKHYELKSTITTLKSEFG